jgi:hypothetical protein
VPLGFVAGTFGFDEGKDEGKSVKASSPVQFLRKRHFVNARADRGMASTPHAKPAELGGVQFSLA